MAEQPRSTPPAGASFSIPHRFGSPTSEERTTPWSEIPRWKKRVFIQCNHASSLKSAPRTEIGGVTSDRAVDLDGEDMPLSLHKYDIDMRCPSCGRVWRVLLASLAEVARSRGGKPARQLVQELPGVSLAPDRTGTG